MIPLTTVSCSVKDVYPKNLASFSYFTIQQPEWLQAASMTLAAVEFSFSFLLALLPFFVTVERGSRRHATGDQLRELTGVS